MATANTAHNQDISRAEWQVLLVNASHYETFKDNRSQFCSGDETEAIHIMHDYGPSHNGCYARGRTTVKLGQALEFLIQSFNCVSIQML